MPATAFARYTRWLLRHRLLGVVGIVDDLSTYQSAEEVLRDAGIAVAQARALGKPGLQFYHDKLRAKRMARLKAENELS